MADDVARGIAQELGETDPEPLAQIATIVETLGAERAQMIVVAAKIMYDVGGMVRMSQYLRVCYGKRFHAKVDKNKEPRTLGGTFFFLASLTPELLTIMRKRNRKSQQPQPQAAPQTNGALGSQRGLK